VGEAAPHRRYLSPLSGAFVHAAALPHRGMLRPVRHRRLILGVALGLAIAGLAAAVVGSRPTGDFRAGELPSERAAPTRPRSPVELRVDAARTRARPAVPVRAHVLLRVKVPAPGYIEVHGLGLTESATPVAPAVFDILADEPGVYRITFRPVQGRARDVGALVVRERAARDTRRGDR
jgi:hypothetical protein